MNEAQRTEQHDPERLRLGAWFSSLVMVHKGDHNTLRDHYAVRTLDDSPSYVTGNRGQDPSGRQRR